MLRLCQATLCTSTVKRTFVVDALNDGARISSVLESAEADHSVSYEVEIPDGYRLEPQPDGSIEIVSPAVKLPDGGSVAVAVGSFERPWALDANGQSVPTHYVVDGDVITQVIAAHPDAAYPLVADPRVDLKWYRIILYFSKSETRTIANGGWGAATIAGICTAAGGPALGAGCLAISGLIVYQAGVAVNSRPERCLRIRSVLPVGIPVAGTYAC